MKWRMLLIGVLLALMFVPTPTQAAGPDAPNDVQLVAMVCTGSGLINGAQALQADETAWGWAHNLTTMAEWVGTWGQRMNDIGFAHGCGQLLNDDGTPTTYVKNLAPWLRLEYNAITAYLTAQAKK